MPSSRLPSHEYISTSAQPVSGAAAALTATILTAQNWPPRRRIVTIPGRFRAAMLEIVGFTLGPGCHAPAHVFSSSGYLLQPAIRQANAKAKNRTEVVRGLWIDINDHTTTRCATTSRSNPSPWSKRCAACCAKSFPPPSLASRAAGKTLRGDSPGSTGESELTDRWRTPGYLGSARTSSPDGSCRS